MNGIIVVDAGSNNIAFLLALQLLEPRFQYVFNKGILAIKKNRGNFFRRFSARKRCYFSAHFSCGFNKPPFTNPILKEIVSLPSVTATPHVASSTHQANVNVMTAILKNLEEVSLGCLDQITKSPQ